MDILSASELGGKAAMVIFSDCDLQQAVNGAAFATFVASGQTCIMGARLIIHKDIYAKFLQLLVAKVAQIRLGDPFDADTQMGPVISGTSRQRISDMVEAAKQQGAKVLVGGNAPIMPTPFDK
jgi:acyl-CoA reductase-like NAD-dependent aldehyde dehydrogenase